MSLSDDIQKLIDNPEDLTVLPNLVTQAKEMESNDTIQIEKIAKLQENYRKAIQMIPIPGVEPEQKKDEQQATPEQAVNELLEEMKNY